MKRRYSSGITLVGKSSLLKEGLAGILRAANFRILTSVSRADDLPTSKAQPCQQLFLIVHTGGDFDAAIEQIELFRSRHPGGQIAIVADRYRLDELVSAFRAGANGYFVNVMTSDVLVKSLELVMMGEAVFPPAFLSFIIDPEGAHLHEAAPRDDNNNQVILVTAEDEIAPQLSPREKSILRYLIEGDSNKCIARKIDIAEATVKVHVKAILRKIHVQNRTQAAIWGMNNRSLALNTRLPQLSSEAGERHPPPTSETHEIKQVEATVALTAINRQANDVPQANRFIRKSIEAGGMRLRK
jgi:DNA-binding NarL/FixJ family response regulator